MREALGLAPKRANRAQGHAEAAHVHGLGFSRFRSQRMKAVEGKGGVKRGSTRNMRGVRSVRSVKYGIPQMRGNIGKDKEKRRHA
ncbi:hypothetical protein M0R45_008495 [Rubus argutus]|uniref:Uncharacterized protein n=1 Tax=Rubus argutus TaxID=59490 RepID=A0AAW1Y1R5_RUBAR